MSAPVTHDQLQAELAPIRERLDRTATRDELQAELAPIRERLDRTATKDELQAELAPIRERLDRTATKDELAAAVAELATKRDLERYATKLDLEGWGHAIVDRLDRAVATLRTEMRSMRIDLHEDLSRGTLAAGEEHRRELAVIDEKYADLPARVAALEDDR